MSIDTDLPVAADADSRRPWRAAGWIVLYGVAWVLGYYVSTYYWFLPAGLRFASLWCTPRRWWPWLALSEFAAILLVLLLGDPYRTWTGFVLGVIAPWLLHATVIALSLRSRAECIPDTPQRMGRLLLAMLAAAALTAVPLTWMSLLEDGAGSTFTLLQLLSFAIGDFIAMLIVVPIWLHLTGFGGQSSWRMFFELLLFFLPVLAIVFLIPAAQPHAVTYVSLLALVPMVFMVFRHGWQGGGWTLAATSTAVYVIGEALNSPATRETMQLFLAIVGAVTLMLGASVAALRRTHGVLSESNAALAVQSAELRALSQRLVRAQEDEQRRIAQEMQGELEQGMTALGTRLGLLARTPLEPSQMAAVDALRGLTQDIHASMRDVLLHLRPVVLDRHGLEQALRAGPIRDLLSDAGVRYDLTVRGNPSELDVDVQGTLYRICQEAAIDCVRRRRGRHFDITLSVTVASGHGHVVDLCVDYDSQVVGSTRAESGIETSTPGLPATRDRMLALGGEYRYRTEGPSIQHRIRFATGASEASPAPLSAG